MIITLLIVGVCAGLGISLLYWIKRRPPSGIDVNELQKQLEPVHVLAVHNLMDLSQQEYLRKQLPKHEFRKLQRQRNRVLLVYVKRIASNSVLLMGIADAATRSEDPEIAAGGRELLQSALATRMFALSAILKLNAGLIFPGVEGHLDGIIARYSRASDSLQMLANKLRTGFATSALR